MYVCVGYVYGTFGREIEIEIEIRCRELFFILRVRAACSGLASVFTSFLGLGLILILILIFDF